MEQITTVKAEKKVAARFSDYVAKSKLKRMNGDDRFAFIEWMFDHLEEVKSNKTRWATAKELTKMYKEEHPVQLNVEWVSTLLKCGILKYEDGTYGFEKEDMDYTVMEVCENPTLLKTLTW